MLESILYWIPYPKERFNPGLGSFAHCMCHSSLYYLAKDRRKLTRLIAGSALVLLHLPMDRLVRSSLKTRLRCLERFDHLNVRGKSVVIVVEKEVLTIYMENPEIPVGKANGTHHSIQSTSEIMGFWAK